MNQKSMDSLLHENRVFTPPSHVQKRAHVQSEREYQNLYAESLEDPEKFWDRMAQQFYWSKSYTQIRDYSFGKDLFIKWFANGETNLCYNALDRHLPKYANKPAFLFVPNVGETRAITYRELYEDVCRVANALRTLGVQAGDRVAIYMPMVPQAAAAMLACARIGAVHNVVFGGFSAASLKERICDSGAKVLVTANQLLRGDKTVALKEIADEAMQACSDAGHIVQHCLVLKHTDLECSMQSGRDVYWHDLVSHEKPDCDPVWMNAEAPLFMLYTSGSTGKPKGVLHSTGGYMVYVATTARYVFDLHDDDLYFCTADIGWITGHSYLVYGPLLNAATSVLFEGIPTHPAPDRLWQIVANERVSILYTAPTALRALMREGDDWPKKHDLSSLRILGSVGEPINPEAWMWYHDVIGNGRCPIVDTWWQTETGGILIAPLPGAIATKPGSAARPFFGVQPRIVREDGQDCDVDEGGYLLLEQPWPGMMRTVYGDHQRFYDTYFARFPGKYFTGDGARKDKNGDFWLLGRIDDVINVSGHRLGTAEIESALVAHPDVAEAAVVGFPHEIKGQGVYAFVTLKACASASARLAKELQEFVKASIGGLARPDVIQFAVGLPKTRSGKIMRRILTKIAAGETGALGDTSTLADPAVVAALVAGRVATS